MSASYSPHDGTLRGPSLALRRHHRHRIAAGRVAHIGIVALLAAEALMDRIAAERIADLSEATLLGELIGDLAQSPGDLLVGLLVCADLLVDALAVERIRLRLGGELIGKLAQSPGDLLICRLIGLSIAIGRQRIGGVGDAVLTVAALRGELVGNLAEHPGNLMVGRLMGAKMRIAVGHELVGELVQHRSDLLTSNALLGALLGHLVRQNAQRRADLLIGALIADALTDPLLSGEAAEATAEIAVLTLSSELSGRAELRIDGVAAIPSERIPEQALRRSHPQHERRQPLRALLTVVSFRRS